MESHIKTEIEEVEQSDFHECENACEFDLDLHPPASSRAPESEPELQLHKSLCLICLNVRSAFSELKFGNTGDGTKISDDVALLGKQLFSIFLLRELLHFPKEECANLLRKTFGVDPGSWCSLCEACSNVVQTAFHAHQQILKLTRKLDKCRQRLKTSLEKSLVLEKDQIRRGVTILDFHDLIRGYFRDSCVDGGPEEQEQEVFLNEDFAEDDVPSPIINTETTLDNILPTLPVTFEDNQPDLREPPEHENPNIESGTKLGGKLYHNDYLYRRDKDMSSKGKVKVYWKCNRKGCKARLVESNETFREAKTPHTCTATAIENQLEFKKHKAKFYLDYKSIHPSGGSLMHDDTDFVDDLSSSPTPTPPDIIEAPTDCTGGAAVDTLPPTPDLPPANELKEEALQISTNYGDTETRKLGCKLLYNDYVYRKDWGRGYRIYWKCQAQGCKGRLVEVETDGSFTATNYPHTCFTTAIENQLKFRQYELKYHADKKKAARKVANESKTVTKHEKEDFIDHVPDSGPQINEMPIDNYDYEAPVDGPSSSGNSEKPIEFKLEAEDTLESDDEEKEMKKIGCRLYYDGHLYRKDKDHEDKIYWRCQSVQGCKGRLVETFEKFKRKYFHKCTATGIENQLEFSKYELKYKKTKNKHSPLERESTNQGAPLESQLSRHRKLRRPTPFMRSELDASFTSYFESDDDDHDQGEAGDTDPIYDENGPDSPAWSPRQKSLPKKFKRKQRKPWPGRPPGRPKQKLKVDDDTVKATKTYRNRYVKKILGVARRQQQHINVEKIRPLEKKLKNFSWVRDPATNTKTFKCNRCGLTKPSYNSCRRHAFNHKIDDALESAGYITCDSGGLIPKFRCKVCGETGRKGEISEHVVNLHLRKQPCSDGTQRKYLGGNRRIASKVFTCDKCDFSSQLYNRYLYHQKKHKMSESIEECGTTDKGQPLFRCKFCGETKTKTVLSNHVFDKHLRKLPKEPGKWEPRTFTCSKCFRLFSKQATYSSHMRMHKIYDNIVYSGGESGGKVRCKLCNEVDDKPKIMAHIKQKHSLELGLPIHQCHSCDKIFSESGPLKRHILSVHENEKRHPCSTCGKRFLFPNDRSVHEKTHLKMDKAVFVCEICGMKCSYRTTLRRHIKRFHK